MDSQNWMFSHNQYLSIHMSEVYVYNTNVRRKIQAIAHKKSRKQFELSKNEVCWVLFCEWQNSGVVSFSLLVNIARCQTILTLRALLACQKWKKWSNTMFVLHYYVNTSAGMIQVTPPDLKQVGGNGRIPTNYLSKIVPRECN